MLTFQAAAEVLTDELGLEVSARMLKRAADENRLPFFQPPLGKKRLIYREALLKAFAERQAEAEKVCESQAPEHGDRGPLARRSLGPPRLTARKERIA